MSAIAQYPSSRPRSHFFSKRSSHTESNRFQDEPLSQPRTHTLGRPVSPPSLNGKKSYSMGRWPYDVPPSYRTPGSASEQNVQAAQANAAEDVVSITSASSKASQASKICRHCKQTAGISNINPLYKCTTCHRHWHKHCGVRTYSAAEKASRNFVCDKCPTQGSSAKRKAEEPPRYDLGKRSRLQGPERSAPQHRTRPASRHIVRGGPSLPQLPKAFRADEQTEARLRELFPGDPNIGVPQRWAAPVHRDPELRRCLRDVYELAAADFRLTSLWKAEPQHLAKACEVQGYLSCKTVCEIKKILENPSARAATLPAIQSPSLSLLKVAVSDTPVLGPHPSGQPPLAASKTSEALVANVAASLPRLIDGAAVSQGDLHSQEVKPACAPPSTSVEDTVERRASAQIAPRPAELNAVQVSPDVGVPQQEPSLAHQLSPRPPMSAVWQREPPSPRVPSEPGHTSNPPPSPGELAAGRAQLISTQPVDSTHLDRGHPRLASVDLETRPPSVESQSSTLFGLPVPSSVEFAAHGVHAVKIERHLLAFITPLFADDIIREVSFIHGWRELMRWADGMGIPQEQTYAKYVDLILLGHRDSRVPAQAFIEQAKKDLAEWATTLDASNKKPTTDHQPLPSDKHGPQHDGSAAMDNATPTPERKEVLRRRESRSSMHGVNTLYSPAPSTAADTHMDSKPPSPMLAVRRPQADSSVTTSVPASRPKANMAVPCTDTKAMPSKWKARRTNSDAKNRDMDALIRVNYNPSSASTYGKNGPGQSPANLKSLAAPIPKQSVQQALSNDLGSPSPSATITVRPASLQLTERQSLVGQLETPSDAGNGGCTEEAGAANPVRANIPALATAGTSRCFIPKPPRGSNVFQTPQSPARGHIAKCATKQHDSRSHAPSSQGRVSPAPTLRPVQANFLVVVPSVQAKGTRRAKSNSPLPSLKRYVDQACQTSGEERPVQEAAEQSSLASTHQPGVEDTTYEESGRDGKIDAGIISRMKAQGMMVEDSDVDDSDSDDERPPQRPMLTLLQTKRTSRNLFDVAPSLRPQPSPDTSAQCKSPIPRKVTWKNMTARNLERRRQQFGNDHPHRVVQRDPIEPMVTTTRLQDFRTLPRLRFDDPPERVRVEVPFSEYMEFPKDLVYVPQTGANAHKQLVFRDGAKEKKCLESGAPRRTRKEVEQKWVHKL